MKPEKEHTDIFINNSGGLDFWSGLALLFIGLKLGTDRLDTWTWVEVLAPIWGPIMVKWFVRLVIKTWMTRNEEG